MSSTPSLPPQARPSPPGTLPGPSISHRHVEVFRALMVAGSVTAAAQRLFTSQPTVSRELARLEHLLQLSLFERRQGRLHPTAAAFALYDEVERSYAGLERIKDTATRLRQFRQGQLAIATLPALAHALLPGACAAFRERHPELSLSVAPIESPALEDRLAAQAFDLGLTEHDPGLPGAPAQRLLAQDEVAVLPAGHPLTRHRRLGLTHFQGQAFVSFHPRDRYRQQIDALFAAAGVERRLAVETDSAVAVCAMVRHGLGLAIVNPLTARALAAEGPGLVVRPLAFSVPFEVWLVRPQGRPANPLVDAFAALLAAQALA